MTESEALVLLAAYLNGTSQDHFFLHHLQENLFAFIYHKLSNEMTMQIARNMME